MSGAGGAGEPLESAGELAAGAAEEHRRRSAAAWQEAATGWTRRQGQIRDFGAPVSEWMVGAIHARPGQRVLELAAGLGETGFMAAELVAPTGGVVTSDQADAMLEGARERSIELGLTNVEFQVVNAEWIDLPVASVDAVLCRWGYMLMADPATALSETRRVLRPGGRLALAVWDALERNPWALHPALELRERGLVAGPDGGPGPFAMGDAARVRALLERAGFAEVSVEVVEVERRHEGFGDFWETTLDLSRVTHDAVMGRSEEEVAEIAAAVARRLEPYTATDGTLRIPGRSLVAAASA
ncbi:MAG TPA: methyltransferase domain-containing protein [Solirubrobacteraceae bacterium]|nr:methyltransferase domain-containing protein [Solirubrobacteraceae bacterium]